MDLLIILGKNKISFDVLTSDQELEVSTATYGPEIDQPQHMKSASHIIRYNTCTQYIPVIGWVRSLYGEL